MKKLVLTFLLSVLLVCAARAEVELPEFSFTGDDISSFQVAPSYMDVSLSFNVSSSFDTYISQEKFRLEDTKGQGYSSEEPGGMYSGSFGTSISSVFVGEKAYRNNIVKNYIRTEYLQVIDSYAKYQTKLAATPFAQETKLLYALSMMETGNLSGGAEVLKETARETGLFGDIATDSLYSYYFNTKNYQAIIDTGAAQPKFTEYSLYAYLYSLLQHKEYEKITEAVEAQHDLIEEHSYLYDFAIVAGYSLGRLNDVAKIAYKATENTAPIAADALLAISDRPAAEKIIETIKDGEAKNVLLAKLSVLDRIDSQAMMLTYSLTSDENRLNVFFFYISKRFPYIDTKFGDDMKFDRETNRDYVNFYNGLSFMARKDFTTAARYLDRVIFNKDLIENAYYYRGIAYLRSDVEKAGFLLLKYIDISEDEEKVKTARFLLGQIYYNKGREADALMLVEDCYTDYCKTLKAEIYLGKNMYDVAEGLLSGIKSDKAAKLRASVNYNKKKYESVLSELKTVLTPDSETDYLTMLTYLKLGRNDDAAAIYRKHANEDRFFESLTENLFLAGEFDMVNSLLESGSDTPQNQLLKAKVLSSLKKYDDAEAIYTSLVNKRYALFDSVYGLLSGYAARNMKSEFLKTGNMILTSLGSFERKDFLLLQAARLAIDLKETETATKMVNRFFAEFPQSQYLSEGYLLRGRLFKDTGRLAQCIQDADRLILKDESKEDGLFLKADCTEPANLNAAVKIYSELADSSLRFRELAMGKIAEVSENPSEVLRAARFFKASGSEVYYTGMERYLGLLDKASLMKNEGLVQELIESKNVLIMPAAYFHLGRILEEKQDLKESARFYMKSYYLFPDSKYSKQSLRKTVDIYKKLGLKDEAAALEKKLKSLK